MSEWCAARLCAAPHEDKSDIDCLVARQFHFYEGKLYKVTETYRGLSENERDDLRLKIRNSGVQTRYLTFTTPYHRSLQISRCGVIILASSIAGGTT